MAKDLAIITKTYDLIQWSANHIKNFSRAHRFGLGTRIENRLYDILDDLIEAKYTSDKADILRTAALHLEQLRYQFRLAKDLGELPIKSHRFAVASVDEIGRQLGGWRKTLRGRESHETA